MTTGGWGALLGALGGLGVWLAVVRVVAIRRGHFEARVLRHLTDLPQVGPVARPTAAGPVGQLVGPTLQGAAELLDRVVGGTASVRRRLERPGHLLGPELRHRDR